MKPLRRRGPESLKGKDTRARRKIQDKILDGVDPLESGSTGPRKAGSSALDADMPALVENALKSTIKEVRIAAVMGIGSDVEALDHIAQNSEYGDTKAAAKEKLEDLIHWAERDDLMKLAQTCPSRGVRTAAVEELNSRGDKGTLGYVVIGTKFIDTKELARSYL